MRLSWGVTRLELDEIPSRAAEPLEDLWGAHREFMTPCPLLCVRVVWPFACRVRV